MFRSFFCLLLGTAFLFGCKGINQSKLSEVSASEVSKEAVELQVTDLIRTTEPFSLAVITNIKGDTYRGYIADDFKGHRVQLTALNESFKPVGSIVIQNPVLSSREYHGYRNFRKDPQIIQALKKIGLSVDEVESFRTSRIWAKRARIYENPGPNSRSGDYKEALEKMWFTDLNVKGVIERPMGDRIRVVSGNFQFNLNDRVSVIAYELNIYSRHGVKNEDPYIAKWSEKIVTNRHNKENLHANEDMQLYIDYVDFLDTYFARNQQIEIEFVKGDLERVRKIKFTSVPDELIQVIQQEGFQERTLPAE